MFPKHVRWYRLLLLLLVVVNCDEAIAKTDSNLDLDSGPGIIVTCPAASIGSTNCGDQAPPMQASFTNSISDGDIAAFSLIGGSITGTPCGEIIILGIEAGTGVTFDGCNFVSRQFLIYDDANIDGILDFTEFVQSCTVDYSIGDITAPEIIGSQPLFISCFSPNPEEEIQAWLDQAAFSFVQDCSSVTVSNNYNEVFNVCNEINQEVTFTYVDECGNSTEFMQIINYEFFDPFIDCFPLLIGCSEIQDLASGPETLTEFNFFYGSAEFCNPDNVTVSFTDSEPIDFCSVEGNNLGSFVRTYNFTDNNCGQTYSCETTIEYFRFPPEISCPIYSCEIGLLPGATSVEEFEAQGGFVEGCGDLSISFVDSPPLSGTDICDVGGMVRTYTVTDECGSTASCQQIFAFDSMLELTCPPDGNGISCTSDYASSGTLDAQEYMANGIFVNACSEFVLTYQDTPSGADPCELGIPITRELTLISSCGGSTSCSYTFVFEENLLEIECPEQTPAIFNYGDPELEAATTVEEFNDIGGAILNSCSTVSISHNDLVEIFDDGFGFIEREYSFTNECGGISICNQFLEVFFTATDLELSCGTTTDIIVDCNDANPDGPSINELVLVQLSNCTTELNELNVSTQISNNFSGITYSGSGTTQEVIFTLSDNFGNTLECPKTITLIGDCPIGVDCSAATDIVVDCNNAGSTPTGLNDLIAAQAAICASAIETASVSPDGGPVTVFNNFSGITYSGSGTTQDIIFTVVDNQGTLTQCPKTVTVIGNCNSISCPSDLLLECQDGYPEPATSFSEFLALGGNFDFGTCGTGTISSSDDVNFGDLGFCFDEDARIVREYTLTDGCGAVFNCTQIIDFIPHTEDPEINCGNSLTVDTNTDECTYQAILTPPTAVSACHNIEIVSVTSQFPNNEVNLSIGQHIIEWIAIDVCGQESACNQLINVAGDVSNDLSLICAGGQLAILEDNGFASVPALQFVDQTVNTCGDSGPYTYDVRRLNPGQCSTGSGMAFSSSLTICCEDLISGVIAVEVRVIDANGDQATCESRVEARDIIRPIISCPPNLDVSCTTNINLADLLDFGVATASDNCQIDLNITESVVDNRDACGVGQILRTFIATDLANNNTSCTQTINVTGDSAGPIITCPQDLTVDANDGNCAYTAVLTPPSATSSCTNVNVLSVTSQFPNNEINLETGTHIIEWTATDECGRVSTCNQTINVVGGENDFSIVCEGILCAYLEEDGTANVPASQYVYEIYDDCGSGGPYVYEIRRRYPGQCDGSAGTAFTPSLSVCCEDLLVGQINIDVRVTNTSNGNTAICQPILEVKDLIAPRIASCPANQNISCASILDLNDLSAFGSATATDNCPDGLTVIESFEDNREDCGFGDIVRIFTFKDASNNTVSCSQVLTVTNNDPFVEDDIVWPGDKLFANICSDEIPGPDMAGSPTFTTNACSEPLITRTDHLQVEGPGCIIVTRNWVVLDWCQFDNGADPSTYRWEYNQIITIQNTIAPVFDTCESTVEECGNEQTCTGMINLSVSATDDCSSSSDLRYVYTLTLENGTIINGQGNSINAPYPYGHHTIVWAVNDGCGNVASCAQDIIIKDCKAPNAICLSGININLTQAPGGVPLAEIWAKDLDASTSDNCTETEALEYAFDMNFTQPALVFDCSHVGVSQIVRMYVRDGDGNVGFCKTTLQVQDNHNLCDEFVIEPTDEAEVMIQGRIATEGNLTMENVDVMLENSADAMHYMTDQNGEYAFESLAMYDDFNLVPTFQDDILNGISTIDVLYIQRHILGIEKLDTPYKIIAADVNNSKTVSAVDIIELRKVILGLKDEFDNSTVWRFVNPNDGMVDPEHPFPYNENMTLTDLDHDASNMDFVGVKTGDVNYSALINGFIPETFSFRSQETLRLVSSSVEGGSIQLTVNNDQSLLGFQLAFRVSGSMDQFNLSSSIIDIDESNYAIHDDLLKISWSSAEAIDLTKGMELFSMSFDENGDYELLESLPMYKVEAYDASLRSLDVEINTEDKTVDDEWQVFRNTPNPFVDNTFIPFTAPRESQLVLSVFDVNGKILFKESRLVTEGYHKWELSATDLGNVHGVLYYRLESDDFSSTQPFIRLK